MEANRPDPDALLADINAAALKQTRGKLRIYFGASAGVGKTYAMLQAALRLRASGGSVLAGIIETHRRSETAALLNGLEVLPRKAIAHKGQTIEEFDLDAALALHPSLILVDELAHTNAPGSRHPKRWQDIEELLSHGIDVHTTLNVQHLESLNDVVGGITGVRVRETVPDTFFDAADEVIIVDVTADELLKRLGSGRVYLGDQAQQAAKNFFRKGNLIALRELALRRTADRVEDDVQAYRSDQGIASAWQTEAALLCCVGPQADAARVVRSTARLAARIDAQWLAVYVETSALQRLPSAQRDAILQNLRLAEQLGATTAVLSGENIAQVIAQYARSRNVSRLVMGRPVKTWQALWKQPLQEHIARAAPELDITIISSANRAAAHVAPSASSLAANSDADADEEHSTGGKWRYGFAVAACAVTSLLATPLIGVLDLANIVMLFLLTVVLVAVKFGRGPAIATAVLNVLSFDFFFVTPRFSFAVSDVQYLLTFAVMLVVGLITGQLTAGLRFQAKGAQAREERTRLLYEFARNMTSALQVSQVAARSREVIGASFQGKAVLYTLDEHDRLALSPDSLADSDAVPAEFDLASAELALRNATAVGLGTDTLPGSKVLYLPLQAPMRTRGVLALLPARPRQLFVPEQRRQLETFAALIAVAVERIHYVEVAQDVTVRIASERLRNSVLSALSHDLRTPLASVIGLAQSFSLTQPALSAQQGELASAITDAAQRMSALVNNLLDMARIQSGDMQLRAEWQSVEELVGAALRQAADVLKQHHVGVKLPANLPLVQFDAVLMERVLVNLLENASKYTPTGSNIAIAAEITEKNATKLLKLTVSDDGPGIALDAQEAVFDKFKRGTSESAIPGVGLGLAICRAIVQAHGGEIWVERATPFGARFCITLKLGTPPPVEIEAA